MNLLAGCMGCEVCGGELRGEFQNGIGSTMGKQDSICVIVEEFGGRL